MTIRPYPTLEDIKRLADQLGVTFTDNGDSFDLDRAAPPEVHGTYRNVQAGINAAFNVIVRLSQGMKIVQEAQEPAMRYCQYCGQHHPISASEWYCPLKPHTEQDIKQNV